jgi:hypothetical protein
MEPLDYGAIRSRQRGDIREHGAFAVHLLCPRDWLLLPGSSFFWSLS